MARTDTQINVRIPDALKAAIDKAAVANGRSLTAEITHRLEASFRGQGDTATIDQLLLVLRAMAASPSAFDQIASAIALSDAKGAARLATALAAGDATAARQAYAEVQRGAASAIVAAKAPAKPRKARTR